MKFIYENAIECDNKEIEIIGNAIKVESRNKGYITKDSKKLQKIRGEIMEYKKAAIKALSEVLEMFERGEIIWERLTEYRYRIGDVTFEIEISWSCPHEFDCQEEGGYQCYECKAEKIINEIAVYLDSNTVVYLSNDSSKEEKEIIRTIEFKLKLYGWL